MADEQIIIGMSGKKQAGKNTACNFIAGMELVNIGLTRSFYIGETGELYISDIFGNTEYEGVLDLTRKNPEFLEFANEHIFPYVKIYSFADILKEEVCIKILGLTHEQCYGTDEEKNSVTHLMWEDMPGVITPQYADVCDVDWCTIKDIGLTMHEPGPMTAREVMQYVGSEIFRKMYRNVWVDATLRQIKQEGSLIALIGDCRFPNEVDGVLDENGLVYRLTRNVYNDQHQSELALDQDKYDWSRFTAVIDNQEMSINEQNKALYGEMFPRGLLPETKKINGPDNLLS